MITKLASIVLNNVKSGLSGISANPNISMEQLEDEVVLERLSVIDKYSKQNLLSKKELMVSINCIPVDCESLDKCPCKSDGLSEPIAHFEIPQIITDIPGGSIDFIGSTDKQVDFKIYLNQYYKYRQYKKRPNFKPYVYIITTPNQNNKYDGWVFNAPLLSVISFQGIVKDPRQLIEYECCNNELSDNLSSINSEVVERLTNKYLKYYRQFYYQPQPNNQIPR